MRVATLNLNGIRAAERKGVLPWLESQRADIVCVQEVRARECDIPPAMLRPAGLRGYFALAQKPGYAGTALYCRRRPQTVAASFGHSVIDGEGRFVCAEFAKCRVVSFYMPSGSSGEARQTVKCGVMDALFSQMQKWAAEAKGGGKQTLLCGDMNIAHTKKDICNWRGNQKNSGFLPEERAWLDSVFNELGWRDVFRNIRGEDGLYSWWSNRGRAWEKNVGWRIDYHLATPLLAARARDAKIYTAERFSDHAPVTVDYRFALQ